jgi:hypothetical protein
MGNEMPGFIEPPADMLAPPGADPLQALLAMAGQGDGGDTDAEQEKKEEEQVRLLFRRIATAKKHKEKWEKDYEVDRAHDYVRGFQRDTGDELDAQGEKKYVINKILAALKARIPALFYYFPYVRIKPSPGRAKSVGSTIQQRCDLLQDTINTIVRQPKTRFKPENLMALKEAHWAFGVIETGYEADWGENPFVPKPTLVENQEVRDTLEEIGTIPPDADETDINAPLAKLKEVPHSETFYVKHIPARQFYVATNDRSSIETQDWVGYWEWMYVEDIKRSDTFQGTENLKANASMGGPTGGSTTHEGTMDKDLAPIGKDDRNKDVPPDMVRVWRIWDQRDKKRYVIAEGHDRILKETEYYYLPLSVLRFEVMPGEWYPIPPIYQQLMEQDETNDSREWLRLVRKGTRPRYIYDKNSFPAEELEKLENDEFFTMVATENGNMTPIVPVQMPQISDAVIRTLALADSGFAEQAASSPIDRLTRGSGGAPTATEVSAMGQSSGVRDSYEQQEVSEWMAATCSNMIKCALEKMTLPQWILINTDPTAPNYGTESQLLGQGMEQYKTLMQANQMAVNEEVYPPPPPPPGMPGPDGQPVPEGVPPPAEDPQRMMMIQKYQEITPEQLQSADDGMQWDITVDVESLSPVTEEQKATKIMQVLGMLAAPGPGQLLALSPPLLKSILNLMGIRDSGDQQNIFDALKVKMQMEQQAAMAGAGQPPGTASQPSGPNPNQTGGPSQPAAQGEAPAKPGGPQPNEPSQG